MYAVPHRVQQRLLRRPNSKKIKKGRGNLAFLYVDKSIAVQLRNRHHKEKFMFNESDHPRDDTGKFTDGKGGKTYGKEYDKRIAEAREEFKKGLAESKAENVVKVDLDAEVQKQLKMAKTSKERQQIAFRYIMDNLRGQYDASDGRTVAIERVGADKMTYRDNKDKLRVCPALADMIKSGEYDHSSPADEKPNKKFEEFAYYKVRVKIGGEVFTGMLNVGIRKNGSSTLYDLRPFYKEN